MPRYWKFSTGSWRQTNRPRGEIVGVVVGILVGLAVGLMLGLGVGVGVGKWVGLVVGTGVGDGVGEGVGDRDGPRDGEILGEKLHDPNGPSTVPSYAAFNSATALLHAISDLALTSSSLPVSWQKKGDLSTPENRLTILPSLRSSPLTQFSVRTSICSPCAVVTSEQPSSVAPPVQSLAGFYSRRACEVHARSTPIHQYAEAGSEALMQ